MSDILVVDDNEGIRDTLSDIITSRTNRVCDTAIDGRDAIRKASVANYKLIIMDIHMPYIDGIEAYKRILDDKPNTTIILMTADELLNGQARATHDVPIIRKPINIPALLRFINDSTMKDSRS
jgi:CheY-like chemotaxis protein